jgi:hypothetical protein
VVGLRSVSVIVDNYYKNAESDWFYIIIYLFFHFK